MAKLQRAFGRKIASLKDEARAALPNGTPEQLADKANAIAKSQGYAYEFKPEKFRKGKGKRRRRVASEVAPQTAPREKTAAKATMIAVEAAQQVGGLNKLKKIVEELL